jgi:Haloacid dehalogenase-like hydrolase
MLFPADAILFDIDGTLVDSTAAVTRTWKAWAAPRGIDLEEILRVCHGRRSEDTVAIFLPAAQHAAAVAELEGLELTDLNDVIALPATQSLLSRLPADRWAAVTSGSQRLMRARLAAAGLPIPEVLVSAEDVNAGKPDPRATSTRQLHSAATSDGAWSWRTRRPGSKPAGQRGRGCWLWRPATPPRNSPPPMPSSLTSRRAIWK